ncbi:hypothetical protein RND71_012945 [Anisodus tanguticus]|uniref:Transcription factor TFIIIC triple barrel domain-containing protein n=1 Tax=Anisodus tanguticus TaxID=243964 RepID=A0AAE1SGW5_9SOLA|nr:hypothetical protein RND71_012945 [Anisodus tanguticus]
MMENQSLSDDNMKEEEEEEAEYVLLDFDGLPPEVHIPPNAPYVLSGLDTLNPILTIDGKIKLIGQYDETIGTCLVFYESAGRSKRTKNLRINLEFYHPAKVLADAPSAVHEEAGPSEANLIPGRHTLDPKQTKSKQVKPVTQLQKILKFRLLQDFETEDASEKSKED